MITLDTKAQDNHGHEYMVILLEQVRPYFDKPDWVLRIVGTPGSWYMTTLENGPVKKNLSIDFGQGWTCVNFDEVMTEAQAKLVGKDRLTAAEDQSWMESALQQCVNKAAQDQ